jgi:uncharacterized membrane protein
MDKIRSSLLKNRFVKVISWRVISVSITMIIMWIFTGNVREATSFTLFLHAILTIANYFFETLWEEFLKKYKIDR